MSEKEPAMSLKTLVLQATRAVAAPRYSLISQPSRLRGAIPGYLQDVATTCGTDCFGRIALNLVRQDDRPGSLRQKRKRPGWDDTYREEILGI
jgi:hypothetical protein